MSHIRPIAAAVVIGLALSLGGGLSAQATPPTAGYTLLYEDGFNGSSVNTVDWYYRITSAYGPVSGYMRAANATVSDGALHLRYTREDVTGDGTPEYVGGGVISTHLFGYGYYEIRARLYEQTPGLHTSFWSMGLHTGQSGANGDPRIEADIAASVLPEHNQLYEIDGFEQNSPNSLDVGDVTWAGGTDARKGYQPGSAYGVDYGEWNVYGYEYTATSVKFYINDALVYTIPVSTLARPFNPMNFWLTALPYQANGNTAALQGTSDFDYFRYYSKPQSGVNLLANGSFDVQTEWYPGLWIVPGWIENYDKPASALQTSSVHDGTRALQHSYTATYTVTTKQNLQYIPNGTYDLTAWVQSSGGQTDAKLRVLGFGAAERNVVIPATPTWTQITIPDVVVTNHSATIAISSTGDPGEWLRFDQVSFDLD